MTTCFMYPGLNGLLRRSDRLRYSGLPEVKARFAGAERALADRLGLRIDLHALLTGPSENIYAVENVSLAAVVICCLQMGVVDRLKKIAPDPDWVIGCSLGDLARAITAQAYDFEDAVVNHVHFTKSIGGIDKIGANIGVAAPADRPFTDEDFAWFEKIGADVSRLTPRFLNVGARFAEIEAVRARAKEVRWATMPILEYPAHSRYILPYVEAVRADFAKVKTQAPRIRMYSSFSAREITDPAEIKEEFLLSITKTIHWHRAVEALVRDENVTRFVNIGPCTSLSRMMKDIDVEVSVAEADDLLKATV